MNNKMLSIAALTAMMMCAFSSAMASTLYVDAAKGNDGNSGKSWSAAKKSINSAYSAAVNGDVIHVADGVYGSVNRCNEKAITIKSVNGADVTTIDGGGTARCAGFFYSDWNTAYTNTVVEGFTITHGSQPSGAGAYGGTFRNCTFVDNHCSGCGAAGYESVMQNCLIVSNVSDNCAGAVWNGSLESCRVMYNVATNCGGACYNGRIRSSVLIGNRCGRSGGAVYDCEVRNSVIAGNHSTGWGGGIYEGSLFNCTVFANTADEGTAGAYDTVATNTVLWTNLRSNGLLSNWSGGTHGYCVLKPKADGVGNTDRDPILYSVADLDGRICENSPCLDAGLNSAISETLDVEGNARIQNNTVDIGAYEGAVSGTGERVPTADKRLEMKPGVSSSFELEDGNQAFIFGVSPLVASDFTIVDTYERRYENRNLIDAEKVKSFAADDLWCQKMTEVNMTVWSGWSDYVGFTNEDDFAEYLRGDADFFQTTNVITWVFAHAPENYWDYVTWKWFRDGAEKVVADFISRTQDCRSLAYLQMDWVEPGTTNIIGSHAVTCCGYALDPVKTAGSIESLKGLFVIHSDNDESIGDGGRYAPNSISYHPVEYDAEHDKFMMKWDDTRNGMFRFFCYLRCRPCAAYGEAAVVTKSGAVPYSWLHDYGLYSPAEATSAQEVAERNWTHYVAGTDPNDATNVFHATLSLSNGVASIGWVPNLGTERKYTVSGRAGLESSFAWHTPVCETDRFFKVAVDLPDSIVAADHGLISSAALLATNAYTLYKGQLSLIDSRIADAEKADNTELDDGGCGEAVGANLTWMTGWAQRAGFVSEDDVFRQYYQQYGTPMDSGTGDVVQFVLNKLSGVTIGDYYEAFETFTPEVFRRISEAVSDGGAVGIRYWHGTPTAPNGNHVVTVWGVCRNRNYLPSDPRYYAGVIISDSDDDKTGYSTAEDAPNRVKFVPVTWDDENELYLIDDGYLDVVYILMPSSDS